jgi:hypothetical protein
LGQREALHQRVITAILTNKKVMARSPRKEGIENKIASIGLQRGKTIRGKIASQFKRLSPLCIEQSDLSRNDIWLYVDKHTCEIRFID